MSATDEFRPVEVTATVDLVGLDEPAEVGVWRPTAEESDDRTPLVVARVPEGSMATDDAELLAEALNQAADQARRLRG